MLHSQSLHGHMVASTRVLVVCCMLQHVSMEWMQAGVVCVLAAMQAPASLCRAV